MAYLQAHDLQAKLNTMLNAMVLERPSDVRRWMGAYIERTHGSRGQKVDVRIRGSATGSGVALSISRA